MDEQPVVGAVVAAALVSLFLTCGVPASAPGHDLTDEQFAHQLLTDWLVRRDLDTVRRNLAPDFSVDRGLREASGLPQSLQSLPDGERALRFPFACSNAPPKCRKLSDCIEALQGTGDFELEHAKVDAGMIRENPGLRPRANHDVLLITFNLKGCNLGASVTLDKTDNRRIVTIFYLAG